MKRDSTSPAPAFKETVRGGDLAQGNTPRAEHHPRAAHGLRDFYSHRDQAERVADRTMVMEAGKLWIPGVMAGMVVSGASPIYVGIYQFVIVAMILAASGITGNFDVLFLQRAAPK